jgi:hypothetical protein
MLNNINGRVIICKLVKSICNGINPAIIDNTSQPVFPAGFCSQFFIPEIPANFNVIRKAMPQYRINTGINTHLPKTGYNKTAEIEQKIISTIGDTYRKNFFNINFPLSK